MTTQAQHEGRAVAHGPWPSIKHVLVDVVAIVVVKLVVDLIVIGGFHLFESWEIGQHAAKAVGG